MINAKAVDGDTIKFVDSVGDEKPRTVYLRIWGIDADELDQKCNLTDEGITGLGQEHKKILQRIIDNTKKFECHILQGSDRWGRSYGLCYADGVNLIKMLHGVKTIAPQDHYSVWVKPSIELYVKAVRDITEVVIDINKAVFHFDDEWLINLEKTIEVASLYDATSKHNYCQIKTPYEWRRLQREMKKKK